MKAKIIFGVLIVLLTVILLNLNFPEEPEEIVETTAKHSQLSLNESSAPSTPVLNLTINSTEVSEPITENETIIIEETINITNETVVNETNESVKDYPDLKVSFSSSGSRKKKDPKPKVVYEVLDEEPENDTNETLEPVDTDDTNSTNSTDTSFNLTDIRGVAKILPGVGTSPVIEYVWVLPDEMITNGTQIELIPSLERSDIYACIVVSDAESRDTISDVFIDIFHPDGSFKYQAHATKIESQLEVEECKDAALEAGLITSSDHDDIDYNIFSQQNWYMYKVYLPMYYHQPSGLYDCETYAVDSQSRVSENKTVSFEWIAGTYLQLDFENIEFGSIQPGAWKIINGDLDMTTQSPTLKNEGNTEILVGLEFEEFRGIEYNKIIDDFDAQLRNMGTDNYLKIPGEHIEFAADEQVWFTYPISLCRQEKIDFSIHADVGVVPDNYQGGLTMYAQPVIVSAPPVNETFPTA